MAYHGKPITTEYQILIKMNGSWVSCMKGIVLTVRTEKSIKNTHKITDMGKQEKANKQTNSLQYDDRTIKWEERCAQILVGKTIKSVRYQYTCEMKDMGWSKKSLIIFFTDGSFIFPSSDDEGNNAGAIFTSFEGIEGIPTL